MEASLDCCLSRLPILCRMLMGKTLKSRLVTYQANGSKLGLLPEPTSYTVSFTHDAVGALTVSYSRKALRGEILDRRLETGLEIAVEVSDGGRWIEPYNGRFVIASRSRNALDVSDTVSLTGVSYGWLLKKALNLDTSRLETKGDEKGTRKFANANAGTIMRTFMDENWNRGGVKVDCSRFTSGADSAGKQWGYMLPSIYYDLGISIQDVLDSLVNNGLCDWRTDARQLLLWNADSVAVCRDLSKSCVVTLAQDVSEAPDDESIDGLASSILVRGDNINFRQDNPNAPKPWGGWELYSSQQGVNKKETAEHLIKPTLANAARVRGQYTRSVNVVEASCLPLIDYTIGDWITAPTVANREKVRVQQVTLQYDSQGFKASLILNDKNYDSSVRLTKRMNGITGGAHLGGASGAIPAPEKDHRVPKAPQNLSANSDAYINVNGYARGMVTARWDDVTLATDGTAMDITSYAVEYRVNKTGYEWHSAGTTTEHTLSWSNLDCGVQILIRVRAVPSYSDQMGEWSSVFALTVAKDTTPPPVPSKPILSSELGVVSVAWDGKTADGGSMPIDWDRNILGERLADGGFKEIAAVSTGIGDYVITGLTAGTSHTYAFRAVDHAGNRSDWSAIASVTVASAVSPEEVKQIQKDLADNQTALKDNTAKLTQAQKDIQANKSNLDAANQTLAQAKTDLSQAQKDIAQTKSDLTTANGEISKAKESAAQAYAEAHSKNHTFRGPDEPKDNLIVGDLWLKTQKYWTRWQGEKNASPSLLADFYTYWQGAPNASPSVLVPLSDRVIDTLVWDGSAWNHLGYADVERNADEIAQAKSDIADNAAKTTDAKKAAENAAAAAKTAQGTADTANGAARTAQDTANAAQTAAKSATATAGQAKDAANAAQTAAESAKKTAGNAETLANTANASANAAKSDAASAKTDASAAKTDAANAKTTAANASSVATQAKATADSAAQSATDAANAAQKANTAAAAAAGVANGKADVLIQSTAPDTSMRKASTLWIDTTNGANTPKRWNGSAWVAVTDKAATDAANAAVKANDAAKTAQSTADKASTAAANAASQANQAQAAAKKAQTTADGKNLIYRGPDEPAHDGLKPGDMWWRTQKYWTRWKGEKNNSPSMLADFYTYWTGAPNNSPSVLVPLSDRVVEVLTWDGTRFEPFDLVANNILASGTVAAKHLAADSVTAEKVKANAITVDKLAANSVTTEKLVADAVTAAKLAANSVQARNIVALAITSDKIAANSVTTGKLKVTEDMTVALLTVHKIQAGEIAANAVTTAALAAGAVDADKLAANSVNASKIVTGAITADKLAANSVTAVKIAAGTITSDKVAAGQFRGYVFTGAIFQSSEAANTGMKLNSTALQMWDSNHNRTVYLDGEGKSNVLTGTFQTRTSGHRVRISPDYQTYIIGGSETFTGDGIEFPAYNGSTAYFSHPAIASVIQSNQVGSMGELDLWSGHVSKNDPAAFMSLRSKPRKKGGTGSGGVTSRVHAVANTDYDEPDESKKSSAYLTLSGDSANGSEAWLGAQDANGEVGVGANIGTGYLHFGGYLGGITNRFTFHAQAAWKAWYPNPGSKIATGASMQVDCTFSPTKYGHYYVVANADSQWAGIIAHPMNTGGQSGFTLKLYNADQPCPVDVYAEFLAYLVK
nr:MAG TPA: tail component [Caudoviricetes sp.]